MKYLPVSQKKNFLLNYQSKNTLKGQINNVQTDLITHAYPLVKSLQIVAGIRLASLEDIAAMKLNAIISNGTRLKDFIDIACLSCYLSFQQMVNAYESKYKQRNPYIILKSLEYTDEINKHEPIHLLNAKYSWQKLEQRLKEIPEQPDSVFSTAPW